MHHKKLQMQMLMLITFKHKWNLKSENPDVIKEGPLNSFSLEKRLILTRLMILWLVRMRPLLFHMVHMARDGCTKKRYNWLLFVLNNQQISMQI